MRSHVALAAFGCAMQPRTNYWPPCLSVPSAGLQEWITWFICCCCCFNNIIWDIFRETYIISADNVGLFNCGKVYWFLVSKKGFTRSWPEGLLPLSCPCLNFHCLFLGGGEGMGQGKMPCLACNKEKPLIKLQDSIWGWLEKNKSWNRWFPGLKKKYKEHIKASPNNTIHHAKRLEPANKPLQRQLSSVVQSYNHSIKQVGPHLLNGRLCEVWALQRALTQHGSHRGARKGASDVRCYSWLSTWLRRELTKNLSR